MLTTTQPMLRTAFTCFLLLLHLFAGAGMAQGAVICVAQDGHFAIENAHPNKSCVTVRKDSQPAPLAPAFENPARRPCQDTPILGVGSHFTLPSNVESNSPAFQPVAISCPPIVTNHRPRLVRSPATRLGLRSIHDSLRNIILIV